MSSIDKNIRTLENGFKAAKDNASVQILALAHQRAIEAIRAALSVRAWQGFTGNAQNSYFATAYDNRNQRLLGIDSGELSEPMFRREKVDYGEEVYMENPVEGEPRKVIGKEEIEEVIAPYAIRSVEMLPRLSGVIATERMGFPVEYERHLAAFAENGSHEYPLEQFYQIALANMMSLA